jgi:hypothetical protein
MTQPNLSKSDNMDIPNDNRSKDLRNSYHESGDKLRFLKPDQSDLTCIPYFFLSLYLIACGLKIFLFIYLEMFKFKLLVSRLPIRLL